MAAQWMEQHCLTNINILNFSYEWKIKNFGFYCIEMQERLHSPHFYTETSRWALEIRRSRSSGDKMAFLLNLIYAGLDDDKVVAKCGLSIIKKDGSKFPVFGHSYHESKEFYPEDDVRGEIDIARFLDETQAFLIDDTLTLLCELTLPSKIHNNTDEKNHTCSATGLLLKKAQRSNLTDDIGSLLTNPLCSDALITVPGPGRRNGTEFPVHRNILSARSKVFATMFECRMLERESGKIRIEDFKPAVVKEMLTFIYTGEAPNLSKMSAELLAISDKYQLDGLKALCLQNPTTDNVLDMIILSDLQNDSGIKRQAIDYIRSHTDEVLASPRWTKFVQEQPDLLKKLMKAAFGRSDEEEDGLASRKRRRFCSHSSSPWPSPSKYRRISYSPGSNRSRSRSRTRSPSNSSYNSYNAYY